MATTTLNDVFRLIDLNEIKFFSVSATDGTNTKVFDMNEDETIDAAKSRFREVMQYCTGGRFIFKGTRSKNDTRGAFRFEFSHQGESAISGIQTNVQPVMNGIPENKVQEMIAKALEDERLKNKMATLEEQNKELKAELKSKESVWQDIAENLKPLAKPIAAIAGSFLQSKMPSVGIAGYQPTGNNEPEADFEPVGENETDQPENNDQQRLEIALSKWAKADPEFLTLIEAVAEMAASNDPMYGMAKSMLKK